MIDLATIRAAAEEELARRERIPPSWSLSPLCDPATLLALVAVTEAAQRLVARTRVDPGSSRASLLTVLPGETDEQAMQAERACYLDLEQAVIPFTPAATGEGAR